ncbi:hypothetical protein [Butyrivibrio sp. AE2015]|uniref:hypothetical protein n=1 Tax=Butyrivibrio sp. AE2015 TaxID=1280663 RepID=UPI0003B3F946|nr:hypothetical protein [Butyrivibrio sp. AE2015]
MIVRKVKIEEKIIEPLKRLIDSFPTPTIRQCFNDTGKLVVSSIKFTNSFYKDLETYENNQKIIRAVVQANNEFYRTDNIPDEEKRIGEAFLRVEPDYEVEKDISTAINLQGEFLDEILNRHR